MLWALHVFPGACNLLERADAVTDPAVARLRASRLAGFAN
jgi:hypothetical protein